MGIFDKVASGQFTHAGEDYPYAIKLASIGNENDGRTAYLAADAAAAYSRMASAARAAGITFVINSSWRSYDEQQALYAKYLLLKAFNPLSSPAVVAQPGRSFHEVGDAVDISTGGQGTSSSVYRWLAANGPRYGFFNTVPSEPWHWQFKRSDLKQYLTAMAPKFAGLILAGKVAILGGAAYWWFRR